MAKGIGLRFRTIANWALLCVNIVMFVLLASRWLPPLGRAAAKTRYDAVKLGMDMVWTKGPVALFVDKDFPHKDRFTVIDYSQSLILSGESAEGPGNDATRQATIMVGADFSITCYYSPSGGGQIRELQLSNKDGGLFDLNADGTYDSRVYMPVPGKPKRPAEIWCQGKWQAIVGISRDAYHKQLVEGDAVWFDVKRGQWLPATEEPISGNAKKTTSPDK